MIGFVIRRALQLLPFLLLCSPLAGQQDRFPVGSMAEKIACRSDPTQTYTLYLPSSFTPDRRWPALLVFDPRGRATFAAEIFRAAAEKYGWIIISSNDTRSDGPMEPNIKALNALWPEVHLRYPTDPKRIYAAGFSGGGIVAWLLAQTTGGLAGILINSGGRLPDGIPTDKLAFVHYGTTGIRDFNYRPMHDIDALLEQGSPAPSRRLRWISSVADQRDGSASRWLARAAGHEARSEGERRTDHRGTL